MHTFAFSAAKDRGQPLERRQGADGGEQRDAGVHGQGQSGAPHHVEETGRQQHRRRQVAQSLA